MLCINVTALVTGLPGYVYSCTRFSLISSPLMSSSIVIVEFGCNITSVYFMLIFSPNFDDTVANASTILWTSSAGWKTSRLRKQFSHKYVCSLCHCSKVCNFKESEFWLNCMLTPSLMTLKVTLSITYLCYLWLFGSIQLAARSSRGVHHC